METRETTTHAGTESSFENGDRKPIQSGDRLLRLKEVMDKTGLGSSTIYRHMDAGMFPRPRTLGGNSVRWRESELDEWIASLPEAQ